jgi:hypothetical protein
MEEKVITTSKKFSINWIDTGKSLVVAVITSVLTAAYDMLQVEDIVFNWKKIGSIALTSAIAYLIKNFFTPQFEKTKLQ